MNDNKQEPPVPPCIMDPGAYDLGWLLEAGEGVESVASCQYLTQ